MDNFSRALAIGFSIAAPVGPIGLLCIRRSMVEGRLAGFSGGLGAATADAVYGLIAACGFSALTAKLADYRTPIQFCGSLFLLFLGLKILLGKPSLGATDNEITPPRPTAQPGFGLLSAYATTFLLTLSNPATILSFVGIFSSMRLNTNDTGSGFAAVAGVFLGSAAWWLLLSTAASWLAACSQRRHLQWINLGAGAFLAGAAVWQIGRLAAAV